MLEQAVYNILRTDSGVRALVTNDKGIAFTLIPRGELSTSAVVVIHSITGVPVTVMESTTDLEERRLQFDCYASDYVSTRKLSAAVRAALIDLSGQYSNGDTPPSFTTIQTSIVNGDFDAPYEVGGAGVGFIYRAILDISFFVQQ